MRPSRLSPTKLRQFKAIFHRYMFQPCISLENKPSEIKFKTFALRGSRSNIWNVLSLKLEIRISKELANERCQRKWSTTCLLAKLDITTTAQIIQCMPSEGILVKTVLSWSEDDSIVRHAITWELGIRYIHAALIYVRFSVPYRELQL